MILLTHNYDKINSGVDENFNQRLFMAEIKRNYGGIICMMKIFRNFQFIQI